MAHGGDDLYSLIASGDTEYDDDSLSSEEFDALSYWAAHPWNFLTGMWPLTNSKANPQRPIIWTMDQWEKAPRPFPAAGYEYIREAILNPIFKPPAGAFPTDVCTVFGVNKSRKVLGTLGATGGIFHEALDLGELIGQSSMLVQWQILKQKKEESVKIIDDRMRFSYEHECFPEFLRRLRPLNKKPVGKLRIARNVVYAVGQNFSEAKGETTDSLVDEAPELRGLRQIINDARPQTRRLVLIGTPPEPGRRGQDPDSVQVFREIIGDVKPGETAIFEFGDGDAKLIEAVS